MSIKNPKVDQFLNRESKWKEEFSKLRQILLDFPLTEEFKWDKPCYALNGGNICLIHGFKEYCALLFMKGALLEDPDGILVTQTENVQAARQIRFANLEEIIELEASIEACVQDAIEVEKAGLNVELKKTAEFSVPEEFQSLIDEIPELKFAFEALTPGRQRAYLLYFSAPKQSKTRQARVEKYMQHILAGKGLNDE